MSAAAHGDDEEVGNDADLTRDYRRKGPQYPYQSHGQWLRAAYALFATIVLALFNGWRTFVPPFEKDDFIASYISVCLNSPFNLDPPKKSTNTYV